jgi:hypothetical protein
LSSSTTSHNWLAGLSVLLIGCCVGIPTYSAAQQRASIQQTPRAVQNGTAQLIGSYGTDQMLRLVFALKPPHMQEEEQFLNQLQDRDSPLFHKYLSEQEWDERFAPSAQDEQAVAAWAQSQGLTITQRYPNRLLVDVEAPVAIIEKALDVAINRYQIGSASYYSNDRDPALPAQFIGIVHAVLGLNNIEVAHTFSKGSQNFTGPDYSPGPAYTVGSHLVSDAGKKPKATTTAKEKKPNWFYGETYWPGDLWGAGGYNYGGQWNGDYRGGLYNLGHCCNPLNNPNNSPPEASIAIAIWGDFLDGDLQSFLVDNDQMAGNVQRYFVDGTPTCCSPETTLDVEWSAAMSNSFHTSADTAEIHVYEGVNNQFSTVLDTVNRALSDGHARVLSMSWGTAEIYEVPSTVMDSYHAVFNQMVGQGWSLVAASGDGGATADCADHLSVLYPASDPDVTAAGGTTLEGGEYGYLSETAWSGGPYGCAYNDGGSGGGCSAYYAAPGYQISPACGANSRSLPDLALNADWVNTPQMFWYNGPDPVGGTSIVAPEIAGFYAQENAYLLYIQSIVGNTCGSSMSAPCAPLGNANPYLYSEGYQPAAPHYPFFDVTSGCNGNDITQQYGLTPFCAGPGYDMVTGWGSANMLQLAWSINNYLAGDSGGPSVSFTGPLLNHWYTTDQTISWTIADTSANNHSPNGVSGYTFYWDSDPGDPYNQPTPSPQGDFGSTPNSFYYGPLYPNDSSGLLYLISMPTIGCHTLIVRAWDNAGQSASSSYGPICYDPYPPYTYATLTGNQEGQYYVGSVLVTLNANDYAGSGVASIMYNVNGGAWQNYTSPFYVTTPGIYVVAYYSTDVAGNVGTTQYADFTIAYNWQVLLSVSKTGAGSGTVTSADGNINCGSTCSYNYWAWEQTTLTATPAPGSIFTAWSGCDQTYGFTCTILLTSDRNPTATFSIPVPLQFIPMTPCRLVDTRPDRGGSGPIQGGTARTFNLPQLAQSASPPCESLASAAAYSLNVSAVPQGPLGYLTVWPDGLTRPLIATMNSLDGRIKANAAIVAAGDNQAIDIYVTQTTDVVLDIDGYFVVAPDPSALAFYPLTPCRIIDTRNPNSDLGGPYLQGHQERDFPVLEATACNIPSSAQAYSMNFAVVPKQALGYLSVWPTGHSRPVVSTLNDLTGTIVANAAIVPAGTGGDIAVYPSNDTDLVVDIDGYFAPPGTGGLSLYKFSPCRVLDTRTVGNGQPFSGTLSPPVNVVGGPCAISWAQAYVFNATVVPQDPLGYLTLWPDGQQRPLASTLNAMDGMITSNMAIVPSGNGSIDAYASGITQLVLDISSYFAP